MNIVIVTAFYGIRFLGAVTNKGVDILGVLDLLRACSSWQRRLIFFSCAFFFPFCTLFFSSCNIFSSMSALTLATLDDSEPVVETAIGAKVPTGRNCVLRTAGFEGFDKTVARLGAVSRAVLESSAVLGVARA